MKWFNEKKVIIKSLNETIDNIFLLEKIGAGHEGVVFRHNNLALKYLKNSNQICIDKNLMSEQKAIHFQNLNLKRMLKPIDLLLNENGEYVGYISIYCKDITKGINKEKETGDFTCEDLLCVSSELEEDINELNRNHILIKDINRGSYIYSENYLKICDMDKFSIQNISTIQNLNRIKLNYIISKLVFYEMINSDNITKEKIKLLSKYVSRQSNSITYLKDLEKELNSMLSIPLKLYAEEKANQLIRKIG